MQDKKRFEFIDLSTADIAFIAYGATVEELFENAALATFGVMLDTSKIRTEVEKELTLDGAYLDELMVDWLNELIFLFDAERVIFSRFSVKVKKDNGYRIECKASGEKIKKHRFKAYVKAATYHMLEVKNLDGGWRAQVVLDV